MRDYMTQTDRCGNLWIWTAAVVVLMVPVAICVYYNAWPSMTAVLKGLLGVAPIYWTVGCIEVITYTPMLGVGGTYLAFVTGNLTSLKAPSALTAMENAGVKPGSEEGEVISTIAIATCSIVTTIVIVIGVCVLRAISPAKDVDCFHPANVGEMMVGDPICWPCTPYGVMELLREYGISASGKHCVVLGRSNIVGKPMTLLLLRDNGTVTVCHSRTPDLKEQCLRADILVAAVGKVNLVTADMVKEGAVVIDVDMNRNEEGKLCGDVDYTGVAEKASFITPVPGGVGPMTRAILMKNVLAAAKDHQK